MVDAGLDHGKPHQPADPPHRHGPLAARHPRKRRQRPSSPSRGITVPAFSCCVGTAQPPRQQHLARSADDRIPFGLRFAAAGTIEVFTRTSVREKGDPGSILGIASVDETASTDPEDSYLFDLENPGPHHRGPARFDRRRPARAHPHSRRGRRARRQRPLADLDDREHGPHLRRHRVRSTARQST